VEREVRLEVRVKIGSTRESSQERRSRDRWKKKEWGVKRERGGKTSGSSELSLDRLAIGKSARGRERVE
jgi:hypothetical protein